MPFVAVHPTPEVLAAADYVEQMLARFVSVRSEHVRPAHEGLDFATKHITYLAIRNIEAIIALARADLVLYPAALALARSAFETSARVIWLVQPVLVKERLSRYLGLVAEQIDAQRRVLALSDNTPEARPDLQQGLDSLLEWQARLQGECSLPPASVPNFRALLGAINRPDLYGNYIVLSQFAHGGHEAAAVFSRQRADGTFGDVVRLRDWYHALAFPSMAFRDAAFQTIRLLGLSRTRFLPKDFREGLDQSLAVLNNEASISPGV